MIREAIVHLLVSEYDGPHAAVKPVRKKTREDTGEQFLSS